MTKTPMEELKDVRGFFCVWDNVERTHVQIPELFVSKPLAEKYGPPFKVLDAKRVEEILARVIAENKHLRTKALNPLAVNDFDRIQTLEAENERMKSGALKECENLQKQLHDQGAEIFRLHEKKASESTDLVSEKYRLRERVQSLEAQLKLVKDGLDSIEGTAVCAPIESQEKLRDLLFVISEKASSLLGQLEKMNAKGDGE